MNIKRRIFDEFFTITEGFGFHVTLNNFASPIPDTKSLRPVLWAKSSSLVGIQVNEDEQLRLLSQFKQKFHKEYDAFPKEATPVPHRYYVNNKAFEGVDGEILYCMIRSYKPKRIYEIGSGNTTYLAAQAILKNAQDDPAYDCELVAIDPQPNEVVRAGLPGLSRLLRTEVQMVPISEFSKLGPSDILFVDSSHVLKIGSDVQYLFGEVIPSLNRGVIVHIHDIFLPEEYPKEWVVRDHRFLNEQYLLRAFLCFNRAFRILWMGSFMKTYHPEQLEETFKTYIKGHTRPGSLWMQREV